MRNARRLRESTYRLGCGSVGCLSCIVGSARARDHVAIVLEVRIVLCRCDGLRCVGYRERVVRDLRIKGVSVESAL